MHKRNTLLAGETVRRGVPRITATNTITQTFMLGNKRRKTSFVTRCCRSVGPHRHHDNHTQNSKRSRNEEKIQIFTARRMVLRRREGHLCIILHSGAISKVPPCSLHFYEEI